VSKSDHDGITIYSPTVPKISDQAGVTLAERTANYLAGAGETDPGGTGCYVRKDVKELSAHWAGLPFTATENVYQHVTALEQIVFRDKINCHFPAGVYDVGDNNFPFRNPLSDSLKDYGGARVYGDGRKTIFQTTSADGADVLQVNATQGLNIDSLKVTAILTGTSGAGSNGVSITAGGKDLDIVVWADDLPYVDKASYMDGGKACTIQPAATTNPIENIRVRVIASNVGYGFGMDISSDALINNPMKNIDVKLYVNGAYRGVALSGTGATNTVPSNGLDWGVSLEAFTVNCQQHYLSNRAWNVRGKIHPINTISTFPAYLAGDSERFVSSILGSKNERVEIGGIVQSVDTLHRIGATTGETENAQVDLATDFQTATTQLDIVSSGGNTIKASEIGVKNLTAIDFSALLARGNTLRQNGNIRTRDFRSYNTFEHRTDAGVKTFGLRPDGNIESGLTSSSALGAYVGKKAEYDDGVFLGYRPIYL